LVVHVSVAFDEEVAETAGCESCGGVTSLATVTVTVLDVVARPAASRATADTVWMPFATEVVFHDTE
jgi:hypothetical protein